MSSTVPGLQRRGRNLLSDERGLSTVEYVIVLVLVAASSIGLWVTFGDQLTKKLGDANTKFEEVQIKK